ncbi:Carbohydrate ABC transporter substrate-binding protein (CUT1 family) OS=Ureibacillus acetophenoni OX=614649 GN=SAMN05877842_12214 PE=4 SV=1 [Ureibacillus acetophenoni]
MKKIRLMLLAMFTLMILAACSSGESSSPEKENSTSGSTEEKIKLTYWYAYGDKIGENNLKLVEEFNKSQDKIEVTAEFQGAYGDLHSKTQAAFAAGNAPEVTLNEIASMQVFAESGLTENLTPFIENDPDVNFDDFVEGLLGNSYIDGNVYGLPYLRSTPIVYVNATMAEELGLDPAGPKTWEEFKQWAKAATIPGERVGLSMPVSIWYYEAYIGQAGGQMLNEEATEVTFNTPEGEAALNLWRDMIAEGSMTVPTGDGSSNVATQDFVNQRSLMYLSSTANLSNMLQLAEENGFELQTYFFPEGEISRVPTGGANMVMTAGLSEEKKQAAWEFIKWMTAKEQTIFASSYTGYLPSRKSAIESDEMKALYEKTPQFKVAVDQLEYAVGRPMAQAYPEIQKILAEEITRGVLEPNLTTEEILNAAAERANALLK